MAVEDYEKELRSRMQLATWPSTLPQNITCTEKDIQQARPVHEILFDVTASEQAIYLSFLRETLQQNPALTLEQNGYQLDQKVMFALHRAHMGYERIMYCMSYSATLTDLNPEQRWIMASTRVTNGINPIQTLPEVACAKPLFQVDPTDKKEMYYAYLKTLFMEHPDATLKENDARIVESLGKTLSKKDLKKCLQYSPQFQNRLDDVENLAAPDRIEQQEKIFDAIQQFIESAITSQPKEIAPEHIDSEAAYQTMQEKLRNLKNGPADENLNRYWQDVMETIYQTMLQINQAEIACKVLRLWSLGIEKAAQEFHLSVDEKFQSIPRRSEKYLAESCCLR